jgi:pimeloyl-CoA synthetase
LNFKPHGARGGRIFYIDTFHTGVTDIEDCVRRLEREAVLIEPPVNVYPPVDAAESGI